MAAAERIGCVVAWLTAMEPPILVPTLPVVPSHRSVPSSLHSQKSIVPLQVATPDTVRVARSRTETEPVPMEMSTMPLAGSSVSVSAVFARAGGAVARPRGEAGVAGLERAECEVLEDRGDLGRRAGLGEEAGEAAVEVVGRQVDAALEEAAERHPLADGLALERVRPGHFDRGVVDRGAARVAVRRRARSRRTSRRGPRSCRSRCRRCPPTGRRGCSTWRHPG